MAEQPTPRQLNIRAVEQHARTAIARRLGAGEVDRALLGVERDGQSIIVRVNSGGNALAVEPYLRRRGYDAADAGSNPDGYGCAVRVTIRPVI